MSDKTPSTRTPRKTMAETRAFERLVGHGACLRVFMDAWRDRVWKHDPLGRGTDPIGEHLWTLVEHADCENSRLDKEYKRIAHPRIYGSDPSEFTWTCYCSMPEKHPKPFRRAS